MSILASSEIIKKFFDVNENEIKNPLNFIIENSTKHRRKALEILANNDKITISKILQLMNRQSGGGSYIAIAEFFKLLEKERILSSQKHKNKTYWKLEDKNLKEYLK